MKRILRLILKPLGKINDVFAIVIDMEKVWSLLAAVGVAAATVFFWFQNTDGAFVAAALGCVAWLLNYRSQVRKRVAENTPETSENV